jgi:Tol biopolymer transport system component/predicted Ser/Thr protein kinase
MLLLWSDHLADARMPEIGQTISHYRIIEKLGAGGMGVVYRAQDTHLERSVAIKVLPAEAVSDFDRKRRFVQEAKSASALNHPNIVHIYDIDRVDDTDFIAMEYIPGKTLDQLIGHKGLQIGEALKYAMQISDALAAAHAAGIVHRDLKPANIMVTEKGLVKVLDFGLAKLMESVPGSESATTQTMSPVTEQGVIAGTVAYMSPEQAEGKKVDARSDIFSFGSLLYEMVTGRRAFRGDSKIGTLSAILHQEPQPIEGVSPELVKIVGRCLRKDADRRIQHMDDVTLALEELKSDSESGKLTPGLPAPARARRRFPSAAVALVALLATGILVAAIWYWLAGSERETQQEQTSLANASFTQLTNQAGEEYYPSLSPDGRFFVYASRAAGNWDIYSQRVGGKNPVNLTRDSREDETQPVFSPDNDFIAFRSEREGGGIFVMGATGESAKRLTEFGYNPAWSPDGEEIVFASRGFEVPTSRQGSSELWVVTFSSGKIRKVDTSLPDLVQPSWSPHGERIAFWSMSMGHRDIWTVAATGGETKRITDDPAMDWNPVWSRDGKFLFFSSDRGGSMNLWRVPIEEKSGKVLGQPEPVTAGGGAVSRQHLSVSRDGSRMAFVERIDKRNLQKVHFDPAGEVVVGQPIWITQGLRQANLPDPSPNGDWVAFSSLGAAQEDLFLIRTDGTGERQITNDSARDRGPRWSPDGKRIAFFSDRVTGRYQVWAINPDGSDLQQLGENDQPVTRPSWSPDGMRMAYYGRGSFVSELGKSWKDHTERLPAFSESESFNANSWSADGKWLGGVLFKNQSSATNPNGNAIFSLETKRFEKLTDFGWAPVWLGDSRRLLFPYRDKIYLVDMGSKKVREIFSVDPYTIYSYSLRVSVDDRVIYYALEMNEADIWLMTFQ